MPEKSLNYRPDIDGLRAIAILAVLLFHIDESWLPGGFVGVDVFFVISGYLITSIIFREIEGQRFSIVRFYERRIRRIMPALFVVLAVVTALAFWILMPEYLEDFAKSSRYMLFSASNFHFARETGNYFAPAASTMPLLHTWSLAVEEQFYIFFPPLLLVGYRWRRNRKMLAIGVLVVGLVSLILSQWMVYHRPVQAFYMLPWRAWEMLAGGFLSLAAIRVEKRWVAEACGLAGLAMICGSMISFDGHTPFPGFSALLPCMGAVLLIFSGASRHAMISRVLGCKVLVFVGLISYSAYLWHWPLIVFSRYLFGPPGLMAGAAIFAASLILGFISWRFVERPFRNYSFLGRRTIFGAWIAVTVVFLAGMAVIKKGEGFPGRFSEEIQGYLDQAAWPERYRSDATDDYNPDLAPRFGLTDAVPSVALLGDSHAQALVPLLDVIAADHGVSVWDYGMSAQPAIPGVTQATLADARERETFSWKVFEKVLKDDRIRTVIIHQRWNVYFHGKNEDPGDNAPEILGETFQSRKERMTFIDTRLKETIMKLTQAGKKVVLVYPVPEPGLNILEYAVKSSLLRRPIPAEMPLAGFNERNQEARILLDAYRGQPGVVLIDPANKLMNGGQLKILDNGKLLYRDDDHLSAYGALYLRELFEPLFGE